MPKRLELSGQKFGDWYVIGFSHKGPRGEIYWLCRDTITGEKRPVRSRHLVSGRSQSAGHRQKAAVTTHGMTRTPTFRSWESMKQRCLNSKCRGFSDYGGRGIKVHEPWIHSFEQFLADMGLRPEGVTLDRIDNDGDYEPGNCRWATPTQQVRNRRDAATITHNGITMSVHDWAVMSGLPAKAIKERVRAGWPTDKALSTPINPNLRRKRRPK